MGEQDALAVELKSLRKGRGVLVDRIDERAGPALRSACGVLPGDSLAQVRGKIIETLRTSITSLPLDLHDAMLAAFALEGAQDPHYSTRMAQAAAQLGRDPRTVRRHVDRGITHLVEIVESRAQPPDTGSEDGPGWHTTHLRTLVNLALPVPEVFETRGVVAERDGLSRLNLALTVTAPPGGAAPDLDIDVFSGGTLLGTRREASDRLGFELVLPRPIGQGEPHEFTLRTRPKKGQALMPHYVCVPNYRCDSYSLRVRYDATLPPRAVWRLTGGFQRDLDDPLAVGEPVPIDESGEVAAEFRRLVPGLAYGFRWREADTPA